MRGSTGRGEGDGALSVVVDHSGPRPVLVLRGDLDVATAPDLAGAAASLPDDPVTVVLDCADLEFVDSSGLTAVVRLERDLRDRGGAVVIRRPRPFVREILRLAGLDKVLEIED